MRAFIGIGAAVALFWIVVIVVLGRGYANTSPEAPCRDELLLLSVNKNLGNISMIQVEGEDLALHVDQRHWMALDHKRKRDIAMAAWCGYAQEKRNGAVLIKSGMTVIGRVEKGVWSTDYGN